MARDPDCGFYPDDLSYLTPLLSHFFILAVAILIRPFPISIIYFGLLSRPVLSLESPCSTDSGQQSILRTAPGGAIQVYWSGFSSASPNREVALEFAGYGGMLLRIRVQPRGSRARDVRLLSAITRENEVLHAQPFPVLCPSPHLTN
jgi:hypothetical protein